MEASTTPISSQIYISRDQTRNQIIEFLKTYMELENVDLTKTSFLSFMVEILSSLSSNLVFYTTSAYKEFFLTKAQIPESILNLSAFLGYGAQDAQYATANVLITVPLTFTSNNVTFTIPEGHKFYAGNIQFVTYYTTTVTVLNNSSVTARVVETEGGIDKAFYLPIDIDLTVPEATFLIPLRQYQLLTNQDSTIDSDLRLYQFVTIDVPMSGQIADLEVIVIPPGSSTGPSYTSFASLYLMDDTTLGYVSRRTDSGRRLYFGNGLIGVQPQGGSTVQLTYKETEGASGNIIAGSIVRGDTLYATVGTTTEVVNYTVTNPLAAFGGEDEESVEEVRRNSIASITTLNRLVSEPDFQNANIIIPASPITEGSLPVLKRSDVKVNEIEMFVILRYNNGIVPTRNAHDTYFVTYIPRQTVITIGGTDYYTLFDMNIDTVNMSASYIYVMYEIDLSPTLVKTFDVNYDLICDRLLVTKSGSSATFSLRYVSTEADASLTGCTMSNLETGINYAMINDTTATSYVYTFTDYTDIPDDNQTFYFTITLGGSSKREYQASFIFRKNLDDFMMSNVGEGPGGWGYTIYDIPVVNKSWYDSISQRSFELLVMQNLMTNVTFSDYKMTTDFVNLKFTNTDGLMTNMQYNPVTLLPVIDIRNSPPLAPNLNDRYIVGKGEGSWVDLDDYIVQCTDTTSLIWTSFRPHIDDVVYISSRTKRFTYGDGWYYPSYTIPLQISVEVVKSSTYSDTITNLASTIRTALIEFFSIRFGPNMYIYRSEVIDVVQEVVGVDHCRVILPQTSVFFNFEINDFTEDELLEYGPEYVYFTEDDIEVRII